MKTVYKNGLFMSFQMHTSPLSVKEFIQLRNTTGWPELPMEMVKTSLENTLFHCHIREHNQVLAMGRVIGDGAAYYYVQDVVVAPSHQQRGLGHRIMEMIESFLKEDARPGATIALLSARGKEGFYQQYGYQIRTGQSLGSGMSRRA